MINYPKARLSKRSRKLVLCNRPTSAGQTCGGQLGRMDTKAATFHPLGADPKRAVETAWIRRNDRDGEYIELTLRGRKQYLRDPSGPLRPRRSMAAADYETWENPTQFAIAPNRYRDPIRVRCPECNGHNLVEPKILADELTRR